MQIYLKQNFKTPQPPMIEPMELQLNNLVLYEGQEVQVTHISHLIITIKTHKYIDVAPEELMPMQLSPELLERCGFEYYKSEGIASFSEYAREGDTHYWNLNVKKNSVLQNSHQFSLVKWGDDTEFTLSIHNLRVTVLHLHQLQNLIKTLTGKELKIK